MSRFVSNLVDDTFPLTTASPLSVSSTNVISFNPSTVDSTSVSTGSIVTPGGLGVGKRLTSNGLSVSLTTTSTAYTNGSVIVAGGMGIAKDIFTNGKIGLNGGNFSTNVNAQLSVLGTNTSNTDGPNISMYTTADNYPTLTLFTYSHDNLALLFDCWYNASFLSSSAASNAIIYKAASNLRFCYNSGTAVNTTMGSPKDAMYIALTSGQVIMATTADSTSATTGCLVANGGVGVAKSAFVSGNVTCSQIVPKTTNTFSCGTSSNVWSAVYAANGVIQTSDGNSKKEIKTIDLGLDFIKKVKPVEFKWSGVDDNKRYLGFVAQDVRALLPDDIGVVYEDLQTGQLGLNYSSLIAPLYKAIQELSERVETLERKVAEKK